MSDDLRDEIERLKRNTVGVIDRGKIPHMNGATLILLLDRMLCRIEALETGERSAERRGCTFNLGTSTTYGIGYIRASEGESHEGVWTPLAAPSTEPPNA